MERTENQAMVEEDDSSQTETARRAHQGLDMLNCPNREHAIEEDGLSYRDDCGCDCSSGTSEGLE